MPSTNYFNELCVKISLLRSIPKKNITACNAVYFRLCIDLMHILPPVTAEGFDGSHHPRFAECCLEWHTCFIRSTFSFNNRRNHEVVSSFDTQRNAEIGKKNPSRSADAKCAC